MSRLYASVLCWCSSSSIRAAQVYTLLHAIAVLLALFIFDVIVYLFCEQCNSADHIVQESTHALMNSRSMQVCHTAGSSVVLQKYCIQCSLLPVL
jgi:hypothetical protein